MNHSSIEAEKATLASIIKYGDGVFFDINTYVKDISFTRPENQFLYGILSKLIASDKLTKLDSQSIITEASVRSKDLTNKYQIADYIAELSDFSVIAENGVHFAKMLARYSLLRELDNNLEAAQQEIRDCDLQTPILEVLASAEKRFLDFSNKLLTHSEDTEKIGDTVKSLVEYYASTKPSQLGILTGFPEYDKAIGGGIRGPGTALIGARAKNGKTSLAINMAINIVNNGIPVLYLDTEMTREQVTTKILANQSDIEINNIEKGMFANNMSETEKIVKAQSKIEKAPFYYHNISGFAHSQTISVIRRWLNTSVGFDANGNLKPCLVMLDYLKTMNVKEFGKLQEHQYLGQYITDLNNFCKPYKLPILAFLQLNRDGIEREDSAAISGSDRLLWLCTSFTILKKKSEDDILADPISNGDRKLIVKDVRFGAGMEDNEYINVKTDLGKCRMVESIINSSLKQAVKKQAKNTAPKMTIKKTDDDDDHASPFNTL